MVEPSSTRPFVGWDPTRPIPMSPRLLKALNVISKFSFCVARFQLAVLSIGFCAVQQFQSIKDTHDMFSMRTSGSTSGFWYQMLQLQKIYIGLVLFMNHCRAHKRHTGCDFCFCFLFETRVWPISKCEPIPVFRKLKTMQWFPIIQKWKQICGTWMETKTKNGLSTQNWIFGVCSLRH